MCLFYFVMFAVSGHAKCPTASFFLNDAREVKTGAVGRFYRTEDKLIFKPVLCLNREKCGDVDLSSYPDYKEGHLIRQFGSIAEFKYGNLEAIVSQEETFEIGIQAQVDYRNKHARNQINPKNLRVVGGSCDPVGFSILLLTSSFYSDSGFGKVLLAGGKSKDSYIKKFNITYANEKVRGCGCEERFDATKREFEYFPHLIEGYYEKKGDRVFFVEESNQNISGNYKVIRKIELLEKDKCNPFLGDLLGKRIRLSTQNKIKAGLTKIPYINACRADFELRK